MRWLASSGFCLVLFDVQVNRRWVHAALTYVEKQDLNPVLIRNPDNPDQTLWIKLPTAAVAVKTFGWLVDTQFEIVKS